MRRNNAMICKIETALPSNGRVPLYELSNLPVSVVDPSACRSIGTYPVKDLIRKMR